jgi:hypothetical protein
MEEGQRRLTSFIKISCLAVVRQKPNLIIYRGLLELLRMNAHFLGVVFLGLLVLFSL